MLTRPQPNEAKSYISKIIAGGYGFPIVFILQFSAAFIGFFIILILLNRDLLFSVPTSKEPLASPTAAVISNSLLYTYNEYDAPFFNETVTEYQSRLISWLPPTAPGSLSPEPLQTIFVSIASYRDNLCQKTMKRVFESAAHPERVFVGLCDQYIIGGDSDDSSCLSALPDRFKRQVRQVYVDGNRGLGPTYARYIASKLWAGEHIFMQIDSHSDFLDKWDNHLVDILDKLPNPLKSIITHYPVSDHSQLGRHPVPWICKTTTKFAPPGLVIQLPLTCSMENMAPGVSLDSSGHRTTCASPLVHRHCLRHVISTKFHRFLGAGFFAGRSTLLQAAPYDRCKTRYNVPLTVLMNVVETDLPFLFHGEELLIAARLWTSGWDLYTPSINLVSHSYGGRDKNVFVQVPSWFIMAKRSEARARFLLRSPLPIDTDPDYSFDMSEIEELGMGRVRPIEDYFQYAGLDLKSGNYTSRCDSWYDPVNGIWHPIVPDLGNTP